MEHYFDTDNFDYDVKYLSFLGLGKEGEVYKFLVTVTNKSTKQKKELILAGKRLISPFISLQRHFENLYTLQELGLTLYTVRRFKTSFPITIKSEVCDSRKMIFMTDISRFENCRDIIPINVKFMLNPQFTSKFTPAERLQVYRKIIADAAFLMKHNYYMIDVDAWMVFRQEKPTAMMVDVGSLHHALFSFVARNKTKNFFEKLWYMVVGEPEQLKEIVSNLIFDTGLLDTDTVKF